MEHGITRLEAFTKVLDILENCNAINYGTRGKFTRTAFLNALIETAEGKPTWKLLNYSDKSGLVRMIKAKFSQLLLNGKVKTGGKTGRWDIFLLYLINYKYCPKCNLCYTFNNFNNNKAETYGKQTYCKVCGNERSKKYKRENKTKVAIQQVNRRKETTLHIINVMKRESKLPECEICGYKENWAALEFHHINTLLKKEEYAKNTTPGGYIMAVSKELAEERYMKEIDNLTLLCRNCHQKEHFTDRDSQIGLKDSTKYLGYNYKCSICEEDEHLHLHHNNPKEKDNSFGNFKSLSKKRILDDGLLEKELNKDVSILCGNHHIEIHHPIWKIENITGENR